jgi:hypothetical protein
MIAASDIYDKLTDRTRAIALSSIRAVHLLALRKTRLIRDIDRREALLSSLS